MNAFRRTPDGGREVPDGHGPGTAERLGPYKLLGHIGRGGMADVYQAEREGPAGQRELCVVKRIRTDRKRSPELLRMLADEARLTARLDHPNIIRVREFATHGDTSFIAMDYIDGRDLAWLMNRYRDESAGIPVAVAAYVAHEVARGLAHAHALIDEHGNPISLIHRDISPSNVMLQKSGHVKIFDFGVAKAAQQYRQNLTRVGHIRGKVTYMSPEQLRGQTVDDRTDVFAVAVVLWEMLIGRRLFQEKDGVETIAIMQKTIAAPASVRLDVPPKLDDLVVRCLLRDPAGRPSAAELADRLVPFIGDVIKARAALAALLLRHGGSDEGKTKLFAAPEKAPVTAAGPLDPERTGSHDRTPGRTGWRPAGSGASTVVAAVAEQQSAVTVPLHALPPPTGSGTRLSQRTLPALRALTLPKAPPWARVAVACAGLSIIAFAAGAVLGPLLGADADPALTVKMQRAPTVVPTWRPEADWVPDPMSVAPMRAAVEALPARAEAIGVRHQSVDGAASVTRNPTRPSVRLAPPAGPGVSASSGKLPLADPFTR